MIGLGNPGTDYENTYHNAGALALDAVAASLSDGGALRWDIHKKLFTYARIHNWIFVKPLTFMNGSGMAVREASRKFNIPPNDIVIFHDDSDLPLGTWKISSGRGAAGHHGVESAVAALGVNDFTRVRIGIRPENERVRKKAEEFVLRKITKTAAATLKKTFREIAEALQKET
jgi:PTH1 family peptidyl-tRNA hydrolase